MTSDRFQEGLEAAAALIETQDGLFTDLRDLARRVRAIEAPALPGMPTKIEAMDEAFTRFQAAYVRAGGFRNPTKGRWPAARKKFEEVVRRRKHDVEAIISGTAAYAQTRPDPQYVPAPERFLHQEQFLRDWARAGTRAKPTIYDLQTHLENSVDDQCRGT
jgi:hypothetical protein